MNRRTKRMARKGGSSKNKKITIHQIYGIFGDGKPLKEIRNFNDNVIRTMNYCKKYKLKHQFWTLDGENIVVNDGKKDIKITKTKSCNQFIKTHYKQYLSLWNNLKKHKTSNNPHFNPILAADFVRYCILHKEGGIYIDCDIHPIGSITKLKQRYSKDNVFFVTWADDKKRLPYNAVMGARNPGEDVFMKIAEECKESYRKNVKKPIYKQWVGRFIFQVTGHYMINRVLKRENMRNKIHSDILKVINKKGEIVCEGKPKCPNALFLDVNASEWF